MHRPSPTTNPPPPPAPFYFPLRHGRYDVAPGLTKLGRDFGGGAADAQIFQLDDQFHAYRAAKLDSRARAFDEYVCTADFHHDVAAEVVKFIADRLATEHPGYFTREGSTLRCALTDETLELHAPSARAFDALACQVQEDLAVVSTDPASGRHWLSATHVCLPNGWAPREKIGRPFAEIHAPVAGMADMNRRGDEFATIMVRSVEPLVRWAWGVTFDDRLDHHPNHPRAPFDPARPAAFLRVERQTIAGFPARGAALFTIRTYLYDVAQIRRDPDLRDPLLSALRTMPDESLRYKGLSDHAIALEAWLSDL